MTVSNTAAPEVLADLGVDLGREVRARVVHGQDDALDREVRVEVVADQVDRRDQLGQALQGVVLALDRDHHRVGGRERVHRQQTERRRAVEQDVVVVGDDVGQDVGEPPLALGRGASSTSAPASEMDEGTIERSGIAVGTMSSATGASSMMAS